MRNAHLPKTCKPTEAEEVLLFYSYQYIIYEQIIISISSY